VGLLPPDFSRSDTGPEYLEHRIMGAKTVRAPIKNQNTVCMDILSTRLIQILKCSISKNLSAIPYLLDYGKS
jgi:hypothetical protein